MEILSQKPTRIEISYRTIVFTVIFLLSLWFLYTIRAVLLALFVAIILMSALNPLISYLEKKRIPRGLASIVLLVLLLLTISGIIASIVPALVDQTRSLVTQIPPIIERLGIPSIDQRVISDQLGSIPGNVAKILITTFSNLISVLTLLVVTYYLLAERANLHRYLIIFFGNQEVEKKAEEFVDKLEHQIGGWLRGELSLMFIIGIMTYVGLRLLNINYALPLAIIAGLLEIIPNIGPTVAMIPAVLIAISTSPVIALATVALYFLIQQFENNIIVPKVMQKAVGVKPLITIVALMIGLKIAGVLGAILAVPTYVVLRIVAEEIYDAKRLQRN